MGADIQTQLWVDDTGAAARFYQRAFGATVEHRVGAPDDADGVIQLAIGGARFWLAGASAAMGRHTPAAIAGATGRTLLVCDDPQAVLDAARAAGATVTSPVAPEHGWLVGRLHDPFGHEWEIGHPLIPWPPRREHNSFGRKPDVAGDPDHS